MQLHVPLYFVAEKQAETAADVAAIDAQMAEVGGCTT
jgi:hypothetical protein